MTTAPDLQPGDVVEVATPGGLAYLHVLRRLPSYPPVVRLLPKRHATRPADPAGLVGEAGGTICMVPLSDVLHRGDWAFEVVARVPVADAPRFRMPVRDRAGRVLYWWFWDGDGLSYSDDPTEADAALPLRRITGAAEFRTLLESDGG